METLLGNIMTTSILTGATIAGWAYLLTILANAFTATAIS